MPFPWKKTKCSRLSQLVADHLHSPKHGGSLVVETGFPTSLMDLFVKNRYRLKKHSKKKRSPIHDPAPTPLSFFPSANSPPESSISSGSIVFVPQLADPHDCGSVTNVSGSVGSVSQLEDPNENENFLNDSSSAKKSGDASEDRTEVVETNRVFLVVLKMLVLVILALGTKKLAFGITLSAFFMFFLEYARKHVFRFLKPGSDADGMLKPLIQKALGFLRIRKDKLTVDEVDRALNLTIEKECVVSDSSGLIKGNESNDQIAEIQPLREKKPILLPLDGKIQTSKDGIDDICGSKRSGHEEEDAKKGILVKGKECTREVSERETRKHRRAKIKSKLKKLVPKKFRHSNRAKSSLKDKICSSPGEDSIPMDDHEEDEGGENDKLICQDKLEEFVDGNADAVAVVEEKRKPTKGNLEFVVLYLVVLVGLVGGRIVALGLTLLWCLTLKLVGSLRSYRKTNHI